uniref:Reverse transcriptase zinc-binding domain-containing protein n=1 Tax=Fagus sylvatica TaxID=28930 RepID=A0A2N9ERP2_FAGSY
MERRLGGWKRLYLSKGGKLTLLKSTLSNLPTYFLSLFHIPADVACRIEKLQRDFLWHGLGDQPKFHLVNWSKERKALWRQVVEVKYGNMLGGWCSKTPRGAYGVGLWKGIRRGWDRFSTFVSFSMGKGERVKFWSDLWCGDFALKEAFPALFSIAENKEAAVAEYMQRSHGNLQWEVKFVRNLQDWELDSLVSFLARLYSVSLNDSGMDHLCWQQDSKSVFSVHSYYRCLNASITVQFPWRGIWKSKAPPRVAFFIWTAVWGKILTNDNLRKRGIVLVDWCYLCKNAGESSDHIFLHCSLAKHLWDAVLSLFGMHWVMPRTVSELLGCWPWCIG